MATSHNVDSRCRNLNIEPSPMSLVIVGIQSSIAARNWNHTNMYFQLSIKKKWTKKTHHWWFSPVGMFNRICMIYFESHCTLAAAQNSPLTLNSEQRELSRDFCAPSKNKSSIMKPEYFSCWNSYMSRTLQ